MGVRASWPTPELDLPELERDPFAPMPAAGRFVPPTEEAPARIENVGTPIDLSGDAPKLNGRLAALVEEEGRLFNSGVECPVKARDDTSCHACPVSGRYGRLCQVGREQEAICTKLVVIRCLPSK